MRALILFSILSLTTAAFAQNSATDTTTTTVAKKQPVKKAKKKTAPTTGTEKVGTDFHFNDQTVHGHYQSPNEGIVTVEDEKSLGDLLDYHTEYKSRLKESFSIR